MRRDWGSRKPTSYEDLYWLCVVKRLDEVVIFCAGCQTANFTPIVRLGDVERDYDGVVKRLMSGDVDNCVACGRRI